MIEKEKINVKKLQLDNFSRLFLYAWIAYYEMQYYDRS